MTVCILMGAGSVGYTQAPVPMSSIPQEAALIEVLSRVSVIGNGQNGVPKGTTLSYRTSNPGHCALALQPWISAEGSPYKIPAHAPTSLRMHDIVSGELPSDSQVVLVYKDGTRHVIGVQPALRMALGTALESYHLHCRKKAPSERHILRPNSSAQASSKAVQMPRATFFPARKAEANRAFGQLFVNFNNQGSGYKMSLGKVTDTCVTNLTVHIPAMRQDTSGSMSKPRDVALALDWSKFDSLVSVESTEKSVFVTFSKSMSASDYWARGSYFPINREADRLAVSNLVAAANYLQKNCANI